MVIKIAEYLNNHLRHAWIKVNKCQLGLNHDAHQLTNTTKTHRYPEIFNAIKQVHLNCPLGTEKIMSFGCSTGQECLTIQQYFPNAKILGVDINQKNLRKCKRSIHDRNIEFLHSVPRLINQKAPFDIIFCMSVLCRWEETEFVTNCEKIYPFEKEKISHSNLINKAHRQTIEAFLEKGIWKIGFSRSKPSIKKTK